MKVEIISTDNGSGMSSILKVHKHHFQHIFESSPFVAIEEEDFFECCPNPDKAFEQAQKGKIVFNVSLEKLTEKAKVIYNRF